jgi:hypothetical protein
MSLSISSKQHRNRSRDFVGSKDYGEITRLLLIAIGVNEMKALSFLRGVFYQRIFFMKALSGRLLR